MRVLISYDIGFLLRVGLMLLDINGCSYKGHDVFVGGLDVGRVFELVGCSVWRWSCRRK